MFKILIFIGRHTDIHSGLQLYIVIKYYLIITFDRIKSFAFQCLKDKISI